MFRFVAFAWNPADDTSRARAESLSSSLKESNPDWRPALVTKSLHVYVTGSGSGVSGVQPLPDSCGVIVGTLFRRNTPDSGGDSVPRDVKLDDREGQKICLSHGQELIDSYWGYYVAFLQTDQGKVKRILRSPMGDLPCFHTTYENTHVFCSWPEDLARLRRLKLTINWEYLAVLTGIGHPCYLGESGITELAPIQGGECLTLKDHGATRSFYWHPGKIVAGSTFEDSGEAADAIRTAAVASVNAWASQCKAVIHRFSGGFDSSVVATCLSRSPNRPRVTYLNYYYEGPRGDERPFARIVAGHTGAELVEKELEFGSVEGIQEVSRTSTPVIDVLDWKHQSYERDLARARGATAVFMGSKGDTLFEKSTYLYPAADYLLLKGLRPDLLAIAFDVALYRRVSIWKVLAAAARDRWSQRPRGAWNIYEVHRKLGLLEDELLLAPDDAIPGLFETARRLRHPWLESATGLPTGKLFQIATLPIETFYQVPYREPADPPIIMPLSSQPLTEACLRTPTYMNIKDGWDRATARTAFAKLLPVEIFRRRTKGGPDAWLKEVVTQNQQFIRSYLLDGTLVREKLLDRRKMEAALPGAMSKTQVFGTTIMGLLYAEAWANAWLRPHATATLRRST